MNLTNTNGSERTTDCGRPATLAQDGLGGQILLIDDEHIDNDTLEVALTEEGITQLFDRRFNDELTGRTTFAIVKFKKD